MTTKTSHLEAASLNAQELSAKDALALIEERSLLSIPDEKLADGSAAIEKLNRKAVKLGLDTFGVECRGFYTTPRYNEAGKVVATTRWNLFEVVGAAPRLAGWTFAGVLATDPAVEGHMVRMAPGFDMPAFARTANPFHCDHCKTSRRRNETFLVRHEDGTWQQVGRNCLHDFTGNDPKVVLSFFTMLADLRRAFSEESYRDFTPRTVDLFTFATAVRVSMRLDGWCSRGKSRELDRLATSDIAANMTFPTNSTHEREEQRKFWEKKTDADVAFARAALEWLPSLWEGRHESEITDYVWNLRAATSRGVVSIRTTGLAASVVRMYERAMELVAQRQEAVNEYLGAEGETIRVQAKVTMVRWLDSDFGSKQLVKFQTTTGQTATTFYSGSREFTVGEELVIAGRIKALKEYKGTKETVLTRVAAITLEAAAQADAEAAAKAAAKAAKAASKAAKTKSVAPVAVAEVTDGKGTTADLVLAAVVEGPKTVAELVAVTGKSECAVRRYAGRLVDAGRLVRSDAGFCVAA